LKKSRKVRSPNQFSTGTAPATIDGDGDLDLLVTPLAADGLFGNDGHGRLRMTGTRLVHRFGSMSMALADIDGDGDLIS
jgi:hypothetical protein